MTEGQFLSKVHYPHPYATPMNHAANAIYAGRQLVRTNTSSYNIYENFTPGRWQIILTQAKGLGWTAPADRAVSFQRVTSSSAHHLKGLCPHSWPDNCVERPCVCLICAAHHCPLGVLFECRVTIHGTRQHCRACELTRRRGSKRFWAVCTF